MINEFRVVTQSIYPPAGPFLVKTVAIGNCVPTLASILYTGFGLVGVAASWSLDQQVTGIAFATLSAVVLVQLPTYRSAIQDESWDLLQRLLVQNGDHMTLVAFDATKIALALHRQFQLSMRAADLGNYLRDFRNRHGILEKIKHAFQDEAVQINAGELLRRVGPDAIGCVDDGGGSACYQAWIFLQTAMRIWPALAIQDGANSRLDTRLVSKKHLDCISFIQHLFNLLDISKPTIMKNDFSGVSEGAFGNHIIRNERYSNKVRLNRHQVVVLEAEDGTKVHATAVDVQGKSTTINLQNPQDELALNIKSIHVIGREDNTLSEAEQKAFFLGVLQGRYNLDSSVFIRLIWFGRVESPSFSQEIPSPFVHYPFRSTLFALNSSQLRVAQAVLAPLPPIIVCQGPPGTGKTTTISAIVKQYDGIRNGRKQKETVWICAQSNVGVKNIAEALVKGGVERFKLVVSKEFHEEWHEHLYESMENKVIRLDQIPTEALGFWDNVFKDIHIILCTLGMLSNPMLESKGVVRNVPVSRLIVDEASQIYIGQYMHLFHQFKNTLYKVAFFGDPKQLPPYKSDEVRGLNSVFEVRHIANDAFFLNTQYRMPSALGNFISGAMYEGKLLSQHDTNSIDCVTFVDAANGAEISDSKSWKNINEVETIVHLVRRYYRHQEFAVITPYEAQRAAIQAQLKQEDLPWTRVFTVDSYQGNEAEVALISLVRTSKPGFLWSRNRVNVMLTRCKKGMVIVTSRTFLQDHQVKLTLIGEMERYWDRVYSYSIRGNSLIDSSHWVNWEEIVQGTAIMPGSSFTPQFIFSRNASATTPSASSATLVQSLPPVSFDPTTQATLIGPAGRSIALTGARSISVDPAAMAPLRYPTLLHQQNPGLYIPQATYSAEEPEPFRSPSGVVYQTNLPIRNSSSHQVLWL